MGDEGGFAPNLGSNREALDWLVRGIEAAGYKPGEEIAIALDPASSEFYVDGKYVLQAEGGEPWEAERMVEFYADLVNNYPIVSIEDGLAENDWEGWKSWPTSSPGGSSWSATTCSSPTPSASSRGIEARCANSILIKLNQIGTLSETLETIEIAKRASFTNVVSHRSGETEDAFIADLAVATNAGQIKTGSLCRSDRIAKYNELLRIEEELDDLAVFPGHSCFYNLR